MMRATPPRNRVTYALLLASVVALGLASRRYGRALPPFVAAYAGDTLYACAAFALAALVLRRWPTWRVGGAALAYCVLVELSQLYHAPWIDAIRATRPGAWVLGFGFLWSDLLCYAAGVALTALVDVALGGEFSWRPVAGAPRRHQP